MNAGDGPTPLSPSREPPCLVAIAGPSCSGKTGLALRLCGLLEEYGPALFPLDGYYRDLSHLPEEAALGHNFDSPDALEVALLKGHLRALARGETVERPVYDYATHRRTGWERAAPGGLVLVEGLFALFWEELLPLFALTIYVDLDDSACLKRRLGRDERERGASREFTLRQWESHVKPMADAHIRPTRQRGSLILEGAAPMEANAARAAAAIRSILRPREAG